MDNEKIIHDLALLYVGKTIDKAATAEQLADAYKDASEKIKARITKPREPMRISRQALRQHP